MATHEYQRLTTEEPTETPTETPTENTSSSPIPIPSSNETGDDIPPPGYVETLQPSSEAQPATLPTYEEYEKEHENEEEFDTNLPEEFTIDGGRGRTIAVMQGNAKDKFVFFYILTMFRRFFFLSGLDLALGDDFTFCGTFFLSFFLNWVGFLMAYCFSRTIAGKCGATSGFGLGLIKLAFLLRNSNEQVHYEGHHSGAYESWFVWVMVLFGWFTFVRGITLYLRYKKEFAVLQREISAV